MKVPVTSHILLFVWLAPQLSRNLVLVGGGTPHTSGYELHTQQQTLAAEWLNSIPGEREEGEGGTNKLLKSFFKFYPELHQLCLTEEGNVARWTVTLASKLVQVTKYFELSRAKIHLFLYPPPPSLPTIQHTSFCTVSLTLTLLEWGSVHTKPASTRWTLFRPFSLFRQMASSSRDSRVHETHAEGGWRYLGEPMFQ